MVNLLMLLILRLCFLFGKISYFDFLGKDCGPLFVFVDAFLTEGIRIYYIPYLGKNCTSNILRTKVYFDFIRSFL